VELFLPSIHNTKMAFLKGILNGTKKVLKASQIVHLAVPKYKEMSMKNLYEFAMQDEDVRTYLPDPN
jgi:hypothetical protein